MFVCGPAAVIFWIDDVSRASRIERSEAPQSSFWAWAGTPFPSAVSKGAMCSLCGSDLSSPNILCQVSMDPYADKVSYPPTDPAINVFTRFPSTARCMFGVVFRVILDRTTSSTVRLWSRATWSTAWRSLISSWVFFLSALRATLISSSALTTSKPAFLAACLALLFAFRLALRIW